MIHVIQCLCENRHCIYAVAYDDTRDTGEVIAEGLKALVEMWVDHHIILPACGICESKNWHYEDGTTRWKTMVEAEPQLRATEADQFATRKMIDERKGAKN